MKKNLILCALFALAFGCRTSDNARVSDADSAQPVAMTCATECETPCADDCEKDCCQKACDNDCEKACCADEGKASE